MNNDLNTIYEWKKSYNTGNEEIDFQHQYFLKLIHRIAELFQSQLSDYILSRHINEILKYAEFHFQSEENIMQLADYPDTDDHAELHKDLLDEIGTVLYYYRNGKRPVENVIEKLYNWFLNHTIYEDSKFGDFQKKQSIN